MGLADRLASAPRGAPNRSVCSVAKIMSRLDPADVDALNGAMSDSELSATVIADALEAEGHRIGAPTVNRHRRGHCRCPR